MKKKLIRTFIFLSFLSVLWGMGLYAFTTTIPTTPTLQQLPDNDAIVVLTGGSNRIQTGFDLLEKEKGKKLFISGVYRGVEVKELMKAWNEESPIDADCCVILGFDAIDTIGNAEETITWMAKEQYTTMTLVTANYHLRRALLAFHRANPDIKITPYPVIPENIYIDGWWKDDKSRGLIIREYSKYVVALILYYLFPEFV